MNLDPLHPEFGATVTGVDLTEVTEDHLYPKIRAAFEKHSLLLFPGQALDDDAHIRLARLFGPPEDRDAMHQGIERDFEVPVLSNQTESGVLDEENLRLLSLQANFLWHTDSTFLPVPALVNILTATVVPSTGGATEFASTRSGWRDMPDDLRQVFRDAVLHHRFTHSRKRISPDLAAMHEISRWPDTAWRALWPNPVTGEEALYIASHAFRIDDRDEAESQALIDAAIEFCTTPDRVYSHDWTPGDVLIWDERAILHRGQPWPYDEPRTLKSICCSVRQSDGLAAVTP